jgi:polar amino acid transport system substrate-binding protein
MENIISNSTCKRPLVAVVFVGFLLLSLLSLQAQARIFRVIGTPQSLFKSESQGHFQGIDIDIVTLVLTELNIDFEIALLYSSKRIQHEARTGSADMLLSFSQTPQRLAYLDYPEVSYKNVNWHFFALKANPKRLVFNTYDDLKDVTIGAAREASYTKAFWDAGLTLSLVSDNKSLLGMLLKKRVELIPMNKTNLFYEAKLLGRSQDIIMLDKPIKSRVYYNPFPKNSTFPSRLSIIRRYDEVLAKMLRTGKIQKIYDKYLK